MGSSVLWWQDCFSPKGMWVIICCCHQVDFIFCFSCSKATDTTAKNDIQVGIVWKLWQSVSRSWWPSVSWMYDTILWESSLRMDSSRLCLFALQITRQISSPRRIWWEICMTSILVTWCGRPRTWIEPKMIGNRKGVGESIANICWRTDNENISVLGWLSSSAYIF